MKKLLVRSKSETDWYNDKQNLDIINYNLRKFKNVKIYMGENEKNEKELEKNKIDKSKNIKLKAKNSLFDIAKEDLQNSKKLGTFNKSTETKYNIESKTKNDYLENTFKNYLKMILRFKLEFDRKYFNKEIKTSKEFVDINLEIILKLLNRFKEKQFGNLELNIGNLSISEASGDSSMDSPDLNNLTKKELEENENFMENFEKFERILEILIKLSPEDLFKEVKSLILNEYESITNEIKTYLENNKNETSQKFLTCISANILYIISTITYKLDYYTITINCLVEKLNRFFISFVESTSNSNDFVKTLDLVQKFVKIKKTFMKDFIENKEKIPEENLDNDQIVENKCTEKIFYNFAFNKFCSFGRYFFNNLLSLLDMNIYINPDVLDKLDKYNENVNKGVFNFYKFKFKKGINQEHFIWKTINITEHQKSKIALDKYFKFFFNSKLASWKYATIQPGIKKIEICRICESTFEINEFVLHLFFCKELRLNNQRLIEIKHQMKRAIDELKEYRELLIKDKMNLKDIFFSPKSEYNQIYRIHLYDRTPKLMSKKFEKNQNNFFLFNRQGEKENIVSKPISNSNTEVEFLDKIILTFSKEKDLMKEFYEKFPYKLSNLITIVHFSIYIFFQNKNSPKYSVELNNIFSKLFILLMKKLNLIENILSLKDSKESARQKIKIKHRSQPKIDTKIPEKKDTYLQNQVENIEKKDEKASNFLYRFSSARIKPEKSPSELKKVSKTEESLINPDSNTHAVDSFFEKGKDEKVKNAVEEASIENKLESNILKRANQGPYLRTRNIKSSQNFQKSIKQEETIGTGNMPIMSNFQKILSNKQNMENLPQSIAQFTNPKTNRIIKKDSLKDFCLMMELTKSKLTTRRVLNKVETTTSASKMYLQNLSSRNVPDQIKKNLDTPKIPTTKKSMVKLVSNELKNLSKVKKIEEKLETSDVTIQTVSESNILSLTTNTTNTITNLSTNENTGQISNLNFENNSINAIQTSTSPTERELSQNMKKNIFNINNSNLKKSLFEKTPSPNHIEMEKNKEMLLFEDVDRSFKLKKEENGLNRYDNLDNFENFINSDKSKKMSSKQYEDCDMKNEITVNKMTEEGHNLGNFKLLVEEKSSQKTINAELETQLRNIEKIQISQSPFKIPEQEMEIDGSSIDSDLDYREGLNTYREESLVNEELDEVDSQFDDMIELMDDIQLSDPYREVENECSPRSFFKIKISDFKLVSEISAGGYGRVDLYKKISTGDIYAIKTVDINKMKAKNISGLLKNEALIMNEVYSEYVVKCYYIFNDDKNYYYVMEYMSGGDLNNFLNEYSLGLETIQFIIAEVILALEYLHSKNIIHRDIKPENIVISTNGHFKLTDFGISEIGLLHNKYALTNKTNNDINHKDSWSDTGKILGTQNYMAPEVIKCEKITYNTDYWSVGVILYELFTSKTPFYKGNLEEVFDNILDLKIDWESFDKEVENLKVREAAKDLINKFLVSDPAERWGDNEFEKIKSHDFFENFDWKNVKSMKNMLVLKHVSDRIKQTKQSKIPAKQDLKNIKEEIIEDEKNKEKNNTKEEHSEKFKYNTEDLNLFYTERIDNLNKKNEDVLKTNIKLKKIEMNTDDVNFTNLINDLD